MILVLFYMEVTARKSESREPPWVLVEFRVELGFFLAIYLFIKKKSYFLHIAVLFQQATMESGTDLLPFPFSAYGFVKWDSWT